MGDLPNILLQEVLPALVKPGPENLIYGQSSHARRVTQDYPCPDYIQRISYPRHEKPEFCVCYTGECIMNLGGTNYRLAPLDACLVGRNVHHFESYVSPEQGYEVIWFFLPMPDELAINRARYVNQAYDTPDSIHCRVPGNTLDQLDAVMAKGASWEKVRKSWAGLITSLKESIRMALDKGETIARQTGRDSFDQKRIDQVHDYVNDHLAEEIKVEEVARHLGLNTNYFQTYFRKAAGSTFVQYLSTYRVRRAQELLNDTALNISQIAGKCGYADPYYFSRVFKKHTGLSPRQFRQKY